MNIRWLGFWAPRLAAFVLAAMAAGSAAYWIWHWPATPDAIDTAAGPDEALVPADAGMLTRLLGGGGVPVDPAAGGNPPRWRLVGVVADEGGRGAALIAEDDKPARSYRVGSQLADGVYLKSVAHRQAVLAPGPHAPAALTLELPAPPSEAVSTVPRPDRRSAEIRPGR